MTNVVVRVSFSNERVQHGKSLKKLDLEWVLLVDALLNHKLCEIHTVDLESNELLYASHEAKVHFRADDLVDVDSIEW